MDLEDRVQEAEESAKEKAEELSDVIFKLRKYEAGDCTQLNFALFKFDF